jgi:hypothetical protein
MGWQARMVAKAVWLLSGGASRGPPAAARRCCHHRGTMPRIPNEEPQQKRVSTTSTKGAVHWVPKKKCTVASCWLFSANAKRVKKMAALSVHLRTMRCVSSMNSLMTRDSSASISSLQGLMFSLRVRQCADRPTSRSALPGLKWGTRFSGMARFHRCAGCGPCGEAAVDGKTAKTANLDAVAAHQASFMASRMALTANSASRWVSWPKRLASSSTRSERVMGEVAFSWKKKRPVPNTCRATVVFRSVQQS